MPSTYSTNLRIELPGLGEQVHTWGTTMNTNLGTLLEQAITGVVSVAMTDANYTLTTSNGSSDEARNATIELTGALTDSRNVVCPTVDKLYLVYNNTTGSQSIVFKTSAGSGITVPNGKKRFVYCDGTNVVDALTDLPSGTQIGGVDIVTLSASQTLTNKTLTAPSISTPTITGTWAFGDNEFQITGSSDATKIAVFEVDGLTTATTRTITVPDASFTMVGLATTQTLTNKTLTSPTITTPTVNVLDNALTIQDNVDATKQAQFQASGITTATTRTYTLPNADGTLLLSDGSGTSLTGIRTQGKETIWLPASAMVTPTTNGAVSGTTNGTNVVYKTLDFDQTTSESAQFQIAMPKSWNLGTLTFIAYWTASAGSGTVTWSLAAGAVSNDDVLDTTFGTAVTVTDTLLATGDLMVADESGAITVGGTPAVGDLVCFKILRDISDTLTGDAKLVGIKLLYTTNAGNDS